jgi:hypothetical protein
MALAEVMSGCGDEDDEVVVTVVLALRLGEEPTACIGATAEDNWELVTG